MRTESKNRLLLLVNLSLVAFLLMTSFGAKNSFKNLEVGELVIRDPNSENTITLGFSGKNAMITFRSQETVMGRVAVEDQGMTLAFNDMNGSERLNLKSGVVPSISLKNEEERTIGTWTVLSDGGAGLGLADRGGSAATILRGGSSPSVSFFSEQNEPMAAMGMIQKVPHLLISGAVGNEGILVHGGKPSSMLFVDEVGKVKILISKNGVFQGKQENPGQESKKEKKVFSFKDNDLLFPESEFVDQQVR